MHNFISLNIHRENINQNLYHKRWHKLINLLPNNAAIIVCSGSNIYRNNDAEYPFRANSNFLYLTGFTEPNSAICLIKKNDNLSSIFFALPKNEKEEIWHGVRCGYKQAGEYLKVDISYSIDDISQIMPLILAQVEACSIDFSALYDEHTLVKDILFTWLNSVQNLQRMGHTPANNIINLQEYIAKLRLIKDEYEQNIMHKAGKISAKAHINAMQKAKAGLAEYHLEAELLHTFIENGSQNAAYNSIVATGFNACILHHRAGNSILKDGDLCLIDAACEVDGYASDITRTFPVNGKFSEQQRQVYLIVLQAQQQAILQAKSGISFDNIHEIALNILVEGMLDIGLLSKQKYGNAANAIQDKAYQQFYMHRTSHWLGLDVHDVGIYKENIKDNNLNIDFDLSKTIHDNMQQLAKSKPSIILQEGMCLTIEPAIYIKPCANVDSKYWNIGIRIEDDIIIGQNKCQILTRDVPVEINEIEAVMNANR